MRALMILALLAGSGLSTWLGGLQPGRAGNNGPPRRIVCLSPALVEVICHLGAGERLCAIGDFVKYPPEILALPRVGGIINPNFERVLALDPDLLVAQGKSSKLRYFASCHGIATLDPPLKLDNLADLYTAYERLGRALGRETIAREAAAGIRRQLAAVATEVGRRGERPAVLLALGFREGTLAGLLTVTNKTFLGEIAEIAGGRNIFGNAMGMWPAASLETISLAAPAVICEFRPTENANAAVARRLWQDTLPFLPAVRAGRIHLLQADYLLIPGPRLALTARRLAGLFHPELATHAWQDPNTDR